MEATGVFSSWVTALMKLSCCSLRRSSRTRKLVLTIIPAMIRAKKMIPKNSSTPCRQLRMIHPTLRATASATRVMPRKRKKTMVPRRLVMRMAAQRDFSAFGGEGYQNTENEQRAGGLEFGWEGRN